MCAICIVFTLFSIFQNWNEIIKIKNMSRNLFTDEKKLHIFILFSKNIIKCFFLYFSYFT